MAPYIVSIVKKSTDSTNNQILKKHLLSCLAVWVECQVYTSVQGKEYIFQKGELCVLIHKEARFKKNACYKSGILEIQVAP